MRLGLSQAAYRWVSYPGLRLDQPEYGFRGIAYPYGTVTDGPDSMDEAPVTWWADRCEEWHLDSLYMTTKWFQTEAEYQAAAKTLADRNIEWIGSLGMAWAVEPNEWPAIHDEAIFELQQLHNAGVKMTAMVNTDPPGAEGQPVPNGGLRFGHFSREIPMARQIENMSRNLGKLVKDAESAGVVLAFENHMDYRISEIVQVVEAVNSPWLRINYDFANSYSVVEDQVEAAHLAAPYTVMSHIKDMRVQSITTDGQPRFFHAPIGYGNVEIAEILEIFQQNSPDPDSISHCIETCCRPEYDPQLWMKLSIEFLETECASYFQSRPPVNPTRE